MNINEIVIIEQLPIIKEKLQIISDEIDTEIKNALSLECNEDSKVEVKNARANLNKVKTALEEKRKQVKSAVMQPYEEFEAIYNDLIKNKLGEADKILKERIDEIEKTQLVKKIVELKEFAKEHIEFNNLESIISFENIGLNITLSASIKSLKEQILAFIKRVSDDLECISGEENKDEILYEYQHNGFNYQNAILTIRKRQEEINKLKQQQEQIQETKEEEKKVIEKVEEAIEITAPVEVEEEKTYQFKVIATDTQIKKVIEFMNELGVKYE